MNKEKNGFTDTLEAIQNKTIYYKLAMVKREIGTLTKKSDNPFFKSKYLELSDLLEAVEPLLDKWGLLLLQPIEENKVKTLIFDADSKDSVWSEMELIPNNNPQQMGSQISYFRRYTLTSLLAIAQIDDDGNHASKPPKKEALDTARFNTALDSIAKGSFKADTLRSKFALTPIQLTELEQLEVEMAIDGK